MQTNRVLNFLFSIFFLFLISCISSPLIRIKNDQLKDNEKLAHIGLLKLKIIYKDFFYRTRIPRISLQKINDWSNIEFSNKTFMSEPLMKAHSVIHSGKNVYEELYLFQGEKGEYYLREIKLYLGLTTRNAYKGKEEIKYFQNFYPNRGFRLVKNGLNIIGTVIVDITEIKGVLSNSKFKYKIYFNNSKQEIENLLTEMRSKFPKTWKKTKSTAKTCQSYSQSVFHFTGNRFTVRYWNEKRGSKDFNYYYKIFGRGYYLDKKIADRKIHFKFMRRDFIIPSRVCIEWTSNFEVLESDGPYGLMLGNNLQNYHLFAINRKGKSWILLKQNGNWKKIIPGLIQKSPNLFSGKKKNHHRIERYNNTVKYYINGTLLYKFNTTFQSPNSVLGFFISPKGQIIFDKLVITKI